jgi:NitT/TauT family transport system permease protein
MTAEITQPATVSAPKPGSTQPSGLSARLRRRLLVNAARIVLVVVFLGGWELGADHGVIDPFFWGKPSGAWHQLSVWVTNGTSQGSLAEQIMTTLEEAAIGFILGVALGVVFGILLGRSRFLADLFSPFIKIANSIPRIILGSIFTVAFGFGIKSKIILVVVLVFFGVFFNAFQGAREVDRNLISNARILGGSRWQVTRQVILPSAFTWIIASLHVSFGFALIGAIVGEFIGAQQGLGELIKNAQGTFDANGVWAAMVIMALVALAAEWLITRLENRLLRWRPTQLAAPGL